MTGFLILMLLSLFLWESWANEVDPSQGSYSCYPCGRAQCGFKDGGSELSIDPSQQFGEQANRNFEPLTCRQIQQKADAREMDPEMCSYYSQVTRSSSDLCECRGRDFVGVTATTNESCRDPNQPQPCRLCGYGKVIGDPEMHLPPPYYNKCVSFYDLQEENMADGQGGYSNYMCTNLQNAFKKDDTCKCRTPDTAVSQCLQQMDFDHQCDPVKVSSGEDRCCLGECNYLERYRKYLCTTLPADPAPPSKSPTLPPITPSKSPTLAPITLSPTFQPSPLPSEEPLYQAPPLPSCKSDSDCDDGKRCVQTSTAGDICMGGGGGNQHNSISSSGGGAGSRGRGGSSNNGRRHRDRGAGLRS